MPPHLKKHLGQHLLEDPAVLRAIVEAAGVAAGDRVLEIGAGPGTLTAVLAQSVTPTGRVVAIELDRAWTGALHRIRERFPQVDVVFEDALETNLDARLPNTTRCKCVANIPYYITSPLVQKLVEARHRFDVVALLMQQEVARRLDASSGRDVGMLSYYVGYHCETRVALTVPATAFRPPPRVDSALLILRPRARPPVNVPFERIRPIIAAAFASRRKMLRSTLRALAPASLDAWLTRAAVDPSARPESLTLLDYARLAENL